MQINKRFLKIKFFYFIKEKKLNEKINIKLFIQFLKNLN